MPTVLRIGQYRFFFYAGDGNEPPHVHIERAMRDRPSFGWIQSVLKTAKASIERK
jgi:hypothetical protein